MYSYILSIDLLRVSRTFAHTGSRGTSTRSSSPCSPAIYIYIYVFIYI